MSRFEYVGNTLVPIDELEEHDAKVRADVIEELREYVVNAMRHDCRIGWGLTQIIDYVDGCFTYKKEQKC